MSAYAKGLGLLFLTIGANYTGDLISCQSRKTLQGSMYARHFMGFLLLAFFVVAVDSDTYLNNKTKKGEWLMWRLLLNTSLMYTMFIALAKTDLIFTFPIVAMLLAIVVCDFEQGNKTEEEIALIENTKYYISIAAGLLLLTGVYTYYRRQRVDHKDFSFVKFWFGVGCKAENQQQPITQE